MIRYIYMCDRIKKCPELFIISKQIFVMTEKNTDYTMFLKKVIRFVCVKKIFV